MTYYFAKHVALPYTDALARTREALKEAGFRIITEIDVADTLKQKLGVDFRKYRILGACNPKLSTTLACTSVHHCTDPSFCYKE